MKLWGQYGRLGQAGFLSALVSVAIVFTPQPAVGTPVNPLWAWALTGFQVLGMWIAGRGQPIGWLVGAAVQPAWITYAVVSAQYGFTPGCVISAVIQTANYVQTRKRREDRLLPASVTGRQELPEPKRV
ncbi:hypothetical protein [Nocardia nova]|uniref:hypothetical protein n=1 Tax=Nocardia nova TaxID=37330 RepID=UPI002738A4FB|nr:hypothetical protein [Nocardia nova]